MEFAIEALQLGEKRGWKALVNGVEMEVDSLELKNPRFGKLVYGKRPEGYDGWAFFENGGGGAVTLLYSKIEGEIFVGLVYESRRNMGEMPALCIAGGFVERGETHAVTQKREGTEELNTDTSKAHELKGVAANSNRAFFVTNPLKNEGIHFYSLEINLDQLVMTGDNPDLKKQIFKLKPDSTKGIRSPDNTSFFHWRTAIRITSDIIAQAAIGRLVADITEAD